MQLRIRPEDYEILVVDNGSSPPVDGRTLSEWGGERYRDPREKPAHFAGLRHQRRRCGKRVAS